MTRLVVKSHRPWQFAVAVITLSMLVAVATWMWLDESHWSAITSRLRSSDDHKLLWEVNQGLDEENARLRERLLMLERTAQVDKQTAVLLQDEIRTLQEEVFRLKGELEFYLGIMDAAGRAKGLDVYGVHVERAGEELGYRMKLILTNVTKSDTVAEGTMVVGIEGMENGAAKAYSLSDLASGDDLQLDFSFRNFKRFESDLVLPENFLPRKISVELRPKDAKQANIKRAFDWPVSTG